MSPNKLSKSATLNQSAIRKPQTQGGGFNRSLTSGYFISRRPTDTERKVKKSVVARNVGKALAVEVKIGKKPEPVYVGERDQIKQNEVWANQGLNMPLKLVFGVKWPD